MSLELVLVFALASPPAATALQSALDRQGIPVHLSPGNDLRGHTGFFPLEYQARTTGFYVSHVAYDDFVSDYPQARIPDQAADAVVSLSWGADFLECAAVFQVATVLVSDFGAKAFDTESASYISLNEVKAGAVGCYEMSKKQRAPR